MGYSHTLVNIMPKNCASGSTAPYISPSFSKFVSHVCELCVRITMLLLTFKAFYFTFPTLLFVQLLEIYLFFCLRFGGSVKYINAELGNIKVGEIPVYGW